MHELSIVILLALLPAIGNFTGGLIAEWLPFSKKTLNYALHAASGIMLAIVSVEVMPTAIKIAPGWLLAIMFMAGGISYTLLDVCIEKWQTQTTGSNPWMIYLAVAADLAGDGMMIGSGSAVSTDLALILALGQVMADLPEGFAVIANFRSKGMKKWTRYIVLVSFIIPVIGAALASYLILRGQSEVIKVAGLVFVAGFFCLAAVEDILEEAHNTLEDTHWSAISFLGGFALFILVTSSL